MTAMLLPWINDPSVLLGYGEPEPDADEPDRDGEDVT